MNLFARLSEAYPGVVQGPVHRRLNRCQACEQIYKKSVLSGSVKLEAMMHCARDLLECSSGPASSRVRMV